MQRFRGAGNDEKLGGNGNRAEVRDVGNDEAKGRELGGLDKDI